MGSDRLHYEFEAVTSTAGELYPNRRELMIPRLGWWRCYAREGRTGRPT
jgi:hypothetical protein